MAPQRTNAQSALRNNFERLLFTDSQQQQLCISSFYSSILHLLHETQEDMLSQQLDEWKVEHCLIIEAQKGEKTREFYLRLAAQQIQYINVEEEESEMEGKWDVLKTNGSGWSLVGIISLDWSRVIYQCPIPCLTLWEFSTTNESTKQKGSCKY